MSSLMRLMAAALFVGWAGCASVPTELVSARDAYRDASLGPAPQLSPTEMAHSKQFLDAANSQFDTQGNSRSVRENAYVAERAAQIADAKARTAENLMVASKIVETEKELAATKEREAAARAEAEAATKSLEKFAGADLGRTPTERKVPVVMIRQDGDKLLITLSTFKMGDDAIPELANGELDRLAERIKGLSGEDQLVNIVGHTDTTGSAEFNMDLSLRRANAVRDALISRGVEAEKLNVEGKGASEPLVGGGKPADRPINRRVDLSVPMPPPDVS